MSCCVYSTVFFRDAILFCKLATKNSCCCFITTTDPALTASDDPNTCNFAHKWGFRPAQRSAPGPVAPTSRPATPRWRDRCERHPPLSQIGTPQPAPERAHEARSKRCHAVVPRRRPRPNGRSGKKPVNRVTSILTCYLPRHTCYLKLNNCRLPLDASEPTITARSQIMRALEQALEHHKAGRLKEAEAKCLVGYVN